MATDFSGDARQAEKNRDAAGELFERYVNRLIGLARSRLPAQFAGRIDPEDVVQSAYRSFLAAARTGRYELGQGRDLWQLLATITVNKLHCQVDRFKTRKRAVEREQSFGDEAALLRMKGRTFAQEPSPLEAVALIEMVEQIMRWLDPQDRRILELRLQGYNLDQIAADTRRSVRTVRRVLERVKQEIDRQNSQ